MTTAGFFASSFVRDRMKSVLPVHASFEWQCAQVSADRRIGRTGAGTGREWSPLTRCQSCLRPAIFDSTSAPAPSPTWQATHSTCAWDDRR